MVKGVEEFEIKARGHDLVWLLEQTKKITSGVDNTANPKITLYDALTTIFNMQQHPTILNNQYLDRFNSCGGGGLGDGRNGAMFTQRKVGNDNNEGSDGVTAGIDGMTISNITCYNFNMNGHYSGEFPEENIREQGGRLGPIR